MVSILTMSVLRISRVSFEKGYRAKQQGKVDIIFLNKNHRVKIEEQKRHRSGDHPALNSWCIVFRYHLMPSPRLKPQARSLYPAKFGRLRRQHPPITLGERRLIRPLAHRACRSLKLLPKKPPVKINQPMFDFVFVIFSAKSNPARNIIFPEELFLTTWNRKNHATCTGQQPSVCCEISPPF